MTACIGHYDSEHFLKLCTKDFKKILTASDFSPSMGRICQVGTNMWKI